MAAHERYDLVAKHYPEGLMLTQVPDGYKKPDSKNPGSKVGNHHASFTSEHLPAQRTYAHVAKVTQTEQPNPVWNGLKRGLLDGLPFVSTKTPDGSPAYLSREQEWHQLGQMLSVPVSFAIGGLLGLGAKIGYSAYRAHQSATLANQVQSTQLQLAKLATLKRNNATHINRLTASSAHTVNPKLKLYYLNQTQLFRNANMRVSQQQDTLAAHLNRLQK